MSASEDFLVLQSSTLVAPVTALEFLGDDCLLSGDLQTGGNMRAVQVRPGGFDCAEHQNTVMRVENYCYFVTSYPSILWMRHSTP